MNTRKKDNAITLESISVEFRPALLHYYQKALQEEPKDYRFFFTETAKYYKIEYRAGPLVHETFIYTYVTVDKTTGDIFLRSAKRAWKNIRDFPSDQN